MRIKKLIDSDIYQNATAEQRAVAEQNYIKKYVNPIAKSQSDIDRVKNFIAEYRQEKYGVKPQAEAVPQKDGTLMEPPKRRAQYGLTGMPLQALDTQTPMPPNLQKYDWKEDVVEAIKSLPEQSTIGMAITGKRVEDYEAKTAAGEFVKGAGGFLLESPLYAAGQALTPNIPVVGAFLLQKMARAFVEAKIAGDIPKEFSADDIEDFKNIMTSGITRKPSKIKGKFIPEVEKIGKEAAWGLAEALSMKGAGKGAEYIASNIKKASIEKFKNKLGEKGATAFGEKMRRRAIHAISPVMSATALSSAHSARTGEMPTVESLAHDIALFYFLHGYEGTKRKFGQRAADAARKKIELSEYQKLVKEKKILTQKQRVAGTKKVAESRDRVDTAWQGIKNEIEKHIPSEEIMKAAGKGDWDTFKAHIDRGMYYEKLNANEIKSVEKQMREYFTRNYTDEGAEAYAKEFERDLAGEKLRPRDVFLDNFYLQKIPKEALASEAELKKHISIIEKQKPTSQGREAITVLQEHLAPIVTEKRSKQFESIFENELTNSPEGIKEIQARLYGKDYPGNSELKKYGSNKIAKIEKIESGYEKKRVLDKKTGEEIEVEIKKTEDRMGITEAEKNVFNSKNFKVWQKGFEVDPVTGKTKWHGGVFKHRTENFERKLEIDGNPGVHEFIVGGLERSSFNTRTSVQNKFAELDNVTAGRGTKYKKGNETIEMAPVPREGKAKGTKHLSYDQRVKINDWLTWQDPDGKKTMKAMKVEKPELSPREKEVAKWAHTKVEDTIRKINLMEKMTGAPKTEKIKGYWTLMRKFSLAEEMGLVPSAITGKQISTQKVKSRKMSWVFGKERLHLNNRPIERDFKQVMRAYMYHSTRYLHFTPMIQKVRDAMHASNFEAKNPNAHEFVNHFLNYLSGVKISKMPAPWDRFVLRLNRNVGAAVIAYNTKVMATQASALINTMTEFGVSRTMLEGVPSMLSPKKLKQAWRESEHIRHRIMDISLEETKLGVRGRFNYAKDKFTNFGTLPLRYIDLWVAIGTYHTAKSHYLRKLRPKGMSDAEAETMARKFAGKKVVRTQASAEKTALAAIQYTPTGKAFTLFGTYGINKWNWLMKEVVGIGNKDISKKDAMIKMTRLMALSALGNSVYEYFGTNPPDAAPFSAMVKSIREDMGKDEQENFLLAMGETIMDVVKGRGNTEDIDWLKAVLKGVGETGELSPIGSRLGTWGIKGAIGAPAALAMETLEWVPYLMGYGNKTISPVPIPILIAKWKGVPGVQEVWKRWWLAKKKKEQKEKREASALSRKMRAVGKDFSLKREKEKDVGEKIMEFMK